MGKQFVSSLLALADIYETRAKCLVSDRFWALTVVAQSSVAVTDKGPGPSFANQVRRITGAKPTDEEWLNWMNANRTSLGDLAWKTWSYYEDSMSIHQLETYPTEKTAFLNITKTLPSPYYELVSESLLQPLGSIPPLYLQIVKYENQYQGPSLPPELGHESWLVEGIRQILGRASIEQIKDFLVKNKKKIDSIRRSFQTSTPKYLGGGADGAAFDIGGGRVLKVFRDEASFRKATLAFERLHKTPSLSKTEAMIYDIGVLGRFNPQPNDPDAGQDVYYYIMEKMKPIRDFYQDYYSIPLPKILGEVAKHISGTKDSKWKALKKSFQDPEKADLIRDVVKKESRELAATFATKPELNKAIHDMKKTIPELKDNWLELYIEEVIMKYLTGRTDLHMGNIGVTGYGELRYYDPAYGGHESSINI